MFKSKLGIIFRLNTNLVQALFTDHTSIVIYKKRYYHILRRKVIKSGPLTRKLIENDENYPKLVAFIKLL